MPRLTDPEEAFLRASREMARASDAYERAFDVMMKASVAFNEASKNLAEELAKVDPMTFDPLSQSPEKSLYKFQSISDRISGWHAV